MTRQYLLNPSVTDDYHYVKYHNFALFPGVKILWKGTVSTEIRANGPFHTRRLGVIIVFYGGSEFSSYEIEL